MKIQAKLLLFAILCSILPLLTAFVLTFNAAQNSLTKAVEENLLSDAKAQLAGLQRQLSYSKQELVTLSELGNMQNVKSGDYNGILQTDLDIFASRTPLFSEILATDNEGLVIATNLHGFINSNLTGTWEYEAPRLGIHFDGRVVDSYRLDMPIATHSVPLYDRLNPDEIIGVLIGSINWEFLQRDLARHNVFGGPQSEQRQFILEAVESDSILYATEGVDFRHGLGEKQVNSNEVRRITEGGREFMMVSIASEPVDGFRDPRWRLHVLLDTEIAYAGVTELKNYFVITAGLVLLLAFITGWFLARGFVNPVNSLAVGAERIAKGDYDYELADTGTKDEIGQLTRSFNEMRVAVRDKQDELVTKTELAEQAAQAKGEFLANMSHEVRTPINGVLGMTELLLNTPLDDTQGRYAKTIYRSGQALLSVINDILDFSKIEAGKLELTISSFDLRELVEDVIEMLAENAARKGIELILVMEPGNPIAFDGDSARLRQVLLNLLSNAIKFTSEGEVRLVVSFGDAIDQNVPVKFQVIDTGIGIAEDNQAQIFDSFVQADGSTTRQYGGTGLGLAISSNLIKLMGAQINVKSETGVGSEFWFEVSLHELPARVADKWQEAGSLQGKRALVVDDTQTNREILEAQLLFWGVDTVVTSSGAKALHQLALAKDNNNAFDLIILDMHMPIMNGTDIAYEIKRNELAPTAKLVLLSSACDNLTRESCRELNISALVAKPVRQVELFNVLIASTEYHLTKQTKSKEVANTIVVDEHSGHILLVEDNPVNQDMMCEMLRILGHTVDVAENGQIALEALENDQFDIVLMDCQMPILDGFGATEAIRKAESLRGDGVRQPIVALTANALQGDREKCIACGMDDYLSKPVSSSRLKEVLKQWLSGEEKGVKASTKIEKESVEPAALVSKEHPVLNDTVFSDLLTMCASAPPGFYTTLVDKFEIGSFEDIKCIQTGLDDNDARLVSSSAHRLKSSSLSIGGKALAELCQALELAAKSNLLDNAPLLCNRIEKEQRKLLSVLRTHDIKAA